MKTLLLILLTSLSCLGQEKVSLVTYDKGYAKVILFTKEGTLIKETTLATIQRDTLYISSRQNEVLVLLDKTRHPKYKAVKLMN